MELEGSAKWSLDAGQSLQIDREFVVPWIGHATWVASQIGTSDASFPACKCRKAAVEPMGPILGSPALYEYAKVVLTYIAEPTAWPEGGGEGGGEGGPAIPINATLQVQIRGGGEFMLFPARDTRWEDNPQAYPSSPIPNEDSGAGRIIIPQQDWVITVGNLGFVNVAKLTDKLGKVNSGTWFNYLPETVLFESFDVDWSLAFENGAPQVKWQVAYHLKVRSINRAGTTYGWQHEYRSDGWKKVFMVDGSPRYENTSFSDLFN